MFHACTLWVIMLFIAENNITIIAEKLFRNILVNIFLAKKDPTENIFMLEISSIRMFTRLVLSHLYCSKLQFYISIKIQSRLRKITWCFLFGYTNVILIICTINTGSSFHGRWLSKWPAWLSANHGITAWWIYLSNGIFHVHGPSKVNVAKIEYWWNAI